MFTITRKEIMWAGRKLTLETGRLARQADGAVLVTYGDTMVLCTVVSARTPKEGIDFFPLTVNYQEKSYAVGRIPGGFFKREGMPKERETLIARLIDRPIRPLFDERFKNETQVICTVLQHDRVNDSDIVALVGTSAALAISGVPFNGPIGAARVGYKDGQFILNPAMQELPESQMNLVMAGTADSVLMVESEASELSEEIMLEAVMFGLKESRPVIDMINELAKECGKPAWALPEADKSLLANRIVVNLKSKLVKVFAITDKQERMAALAEARKPVLEAFSSEQSATAINGIFKKLEMDVMRGAVLDTERRIDGRDTKTVRPISIELDIAPMTHSSVLFTRGETQAFVTATLGSSRDEQIIDDLEGDRRENFMLHYNFPPYCVGEASPMRPPGRREIGHGRLAKRALAALLPSKEECPYTIRLVSEITESNGSSSMATVCGGSLALMAAGIPLPRPVAGIAMGLIKEGDKFAVLTDILGDEDHLGDMDFKVAGTEKGVTALQMDIKIQGITEEIMRIALKQAHEGRAHILNEMGKAMDKARPEVSANAPKMTSFTIPVDKIREVIGSGGKVIRELCEITGAKIDIQDDGTVTVAAVNADAAQDAVARIRAITAEPEEGAIYTGVVKTIMDFGAFVEFMPGRDGLVHISELSFERVEKVTDVLKEGDEIKVKCLGFERGKVRLSYRAVNQETGEEVEGYQKAARA